MQTPFQPYLFPVADLPLLSDDEIRRKGMNVIRKIYKVRKSLVGGETCYVNYLNDAIARIRAVSRLSDNQREELVLYAIERQGATSLTEIVEDTRIDRKSVEIILESLMNREILYNTRKYTPGMDKKNYMYKSIRVRTPEGV